MRFIQQRGQLLQRVLAYQVQYRMLHRRHDGVGARIRHTSRTGAKSKGRKGRNQNRAHVWTAPRRATRVKTARATLIADMKKAPEDFPRLQILRFDFRMQVRQGLILT